MLGHHKVIYSDQQLYRKVSGIMLYLSNILSKFIHLLADVRVWSHSASQLQTHWDFGYPHPAENKPTPVLQKISSVNAVQKNVRYLRPKLNVRGIWHL